MTVEVLGVERRRRWTAEDKSRIIEETLIPGARVSEVARRHGVSRGLLFTWRRLARWGEPDTQAAPRMVPVRIAAPEAVSVSKTTASTARTGRDSSLIEIDLGDGRRVRVGSDIDANALRRVLEALERR
jgi:transposase